MKIERTLFWFTDASTELVEYNKKFYGLGILLNRLLNEAYDGKKIKFINLELSTDKTYELYSNVPKDEPYYYGGHLRYYGVLDRVEFDKYSEVEQANYLWEKAYNYLTKSAEFIKNKKLLVAAEYAFNKGNEVNLSTDYRVVEQVFDFNGFLFRASVWIYFKEDGMYSEFTLEKENRVLHRKIIDNTDNGIGFFLEIYKSIEFIDDSVIIKGHKDVDYLPLKIPIPKNLLKD